MYHKNFEVHTKINKDGSVILKIKNGNHTTITKHTDIHDAISTWYRMNK